MNWDATDAWIVAAGSLAGIACALPGTFLLLRRMSMMGDAISHAVLPGIAIAFLLTGQRSGPALSLGAVAAGLLAAFLTRVLQRAGEVEEGASIGVVFTLLFAGGLLLLEQAGHYVDLDLDCVLFGLVELVPLAPPLPGLPGVPAPVIRLLLVALANALCVSLLYKEWKLTSFDPQLAAALGFAPAQMHYLLMVLTAVTTVHCFEMVGSILVIAMLIVPAACARLLSDRLGPTLLWACLLAALSAPLGHLGASSLPRLVGLPSTLSSGGMAVASGLLFALTVLLAPRHGLLRRWLHQRHLHLLTLEQDLLLNLLRAADSNHPMTREGLRARVADPRRLRAALARLHRRGLLEADELTHKGMLAAASLLRGHRLWESWLHEHTPLAIDHLHHPAERLEHVTDASLRERLAGEIGDRHTDPMGRPIPPDVSAGPETLVGS